MAQAQLTISVPMDLYNRIDEDAKAEEVSKAEICRRILLRHYEKKVKQ